MYNRHTTNRSGFDSKLVAYIYHLTSHLNLSNGNKNIVLDTPSYFGLPFFEILLNLLSPFRLFWIHDL